MIEIKEHVYVDLEFICNSVTGNIYDTLGKKYTKENSIIDFLYNEDGCLTGMRIYDKLGTEGKSSTYTYEDSRFEA